MLFEFWSSVDPAGPQFKQHCPNRQAGNRVGVFHSRFIKQTRRISRWCTVSRLFGYAIDRTAVLVEAVQF